MFHDQAPNTFRDRDDYRSAAKQELERHGSKSEVLWNKCLAEKAISLKERAVVMLLQNIDTTTEGTDGTGRVVNEETGERDGSGFSLKLVNGSKGEILRWANPAEVATQLQVALTSEFQLQELGEETPEELIVQRPSDLLGILRKLLFTLPSRKESARDEIVEFSFRRRIWLEALGKYFAGELRINNTAVTVSNAVTERRAERRAKIVPLVKFENGRTMALLPRLFSQEEIGVGIRYRLQLPLRLAWAISIHKSQGMSLETVSIDPKDCFAEGQVYVSLSRAKRLSGLTLRCEPSCGWWDKIKTSQMVKDFYLFLFGSDDDAAGGEWYSGSADSRHTDEPRLGWDDYRTEIEAKFKSWRDEPIKGTFEGPPCKGCGELTAMLQITKSNRGSFGRYFWACPKKGNDQCVPFFLRYLNNRELIENGVLARESGESDESDESKSEFAAFSQFDDDNLDELFEVYGGPAVVEEV